MSQNMFLIKIDNFCPIFIKLCQNYYLRILLESQAKFTKIVYFLIPIIIFCDSDIFFDRLYIARIWLK